MQAVVMPKLGLTMTEGVILDWLKQPGDLVQAGEAIAEIETEKITYTLEAPTDGTLAKILLSVGERAPVTETIAWIAEPGEVREKVEMREAAKEVSKVEQVATITKATGTTVSETLDSTTSTARVEDMQPGSATRTMHETITSRWVLATPFARKLARESGLDLTQVAGTGPNGRIHSIDVQKFLHQDSKFIPHSQMRKAIARRMTESWTTIPHVTLQRTLSAAGILSLQRTTSEGEGTSKVSLTAVIAFIVSRVLLKHSLLNGCYEPGGCRVFDNVHLGIAVTVQNGLVVPVIRHANLKSILELQSEITSLAERARAGKLHLDELEGGTFTISSLGMYGIDAFTPIIVPPQTGILGIGRIIGGGQPPNDRPKDGTENQAQLTVSLSFDHRALDGVYGAQFLESLALHFDNPLRLLM